MQNLEKIGHFTKADRAYIVDEKDGCYYNTYEWCNEGIEPQINQLQNLRAEDMPYWIPKLSSGESIFIEDLENVKETMPVEYEILKPQNIHTLIVFPIILSNTLKGFIGVDNPNILVLQEKMPLYMPSLNTGLITIHLPRRITGMGFTRMHRSS